VLFSVLSSAEEHELCLVPEWQNKAESE